MDINSPRKFKYNCLRLPVKSRIVLIALNIGTIRRKVQI